MCPSTVLVLGTTRHRLSADRRCHLPATVVTGTQSSATCTWFNDGQEASDVHATPVRCDQTFWLVSQHALWTPWTICSFFSWNCCDRRTCFVLIWKHFCFILSTGTKIRTDSVTCPRSSSRGHNTSKCLSYSYSRRWHRTTDCCSNPAGCWKTHVQASSYKPSLACSKKENVLKNATQYRHSRFCEIWSRSKVNSCLFLWLMLIQQKIDIPGGNHQLHQVWQTAVGHREETTAQMQHGNWVFLTQIPTKKHKHYSN